MARRYLVSFPRSTLLVVTCLFFLAGGLNAQEVRFPADRQHPASEGSELFSLQGDELPRYLSVRNFFQLCNDALRFDGSETPDEEAFYFTIPFRMGIPAEAAAVKDILQAAQQAEAVLRSTLDIGPFGSDEEASRRAQVEFKRREVRRITKIYLNMLTKLKEGGVEPAVVESFIDQHVTPTISMVAAAPFSIEENEVLRVTITEFEAVLLNHSENH